MTAQLFHIEDDDRIIYTNNGKRLYQEYFAKYGVDIELIKTGKEHHQACDTTNFDEQLSQQVEKSFVNPGTGELSSIGKILANAMGEGGDINVAIEEAKKTADRIRFIKPIK